MTRSARHLVTALTSAALLGCGAEAPLGPPLPTGKVAPTLVRLVRGRTLEEWLARADSPDAAVRAEAPWALAELVSDASVLAPLLQRMLGDPDPGVRYAAVVALGRVSLDLGQPLERLLVRQLKATERGTAQAAWASLLARGTLAVPALAETLGAADESLASEVARLLAELGSKAEGAAPALAQAVAVAPLGVRLYAVRALGRLGAKALPAIGDILEKASGDGSLALLELVRAQGARAAALAPQLVVVLTSGGLDESQGAERALTAIGGGALPALRAAAQEHPAARRVAERLEAAPPR